MNKKDAFGLDDQKPVDPFGEDQIAKKNKNNSVDADNLQIAGAIEIEMSA
jgi:hypothetical protein